MAKKSALSALFAELNNEGENATAQTPNSERKQREVLPGFGKAEITEYVTLALQAKLQAKKENAQFYLPNFPEGLHVEDSPVTGLRVWGYDTRRKPNGLHVHLEVVRSQFFAGQINEAVIRTVKVNIFTGEVTIEETLENMG